MGSTDNTERNASERRFPRAHVPRWVVVTGVVLYCSACWAAIWMAGSAGIEMIRTASANTQ